MKYAQIRPGVFEIATKLPHKTCGLLRLLLIALHLLLWPVVFLLAVVNVRGLSILLAVWTGDISSSIHIFGRLH